MLNKKKIRKAHELDDLLNDCIAVHRDETFNEVRGDSIELTKYKTKMAYPGHYPFEVEIDEANAAIEKARRIKNFVMNKAKELEY
jgi:HEPN domain-containing protein